MFKLATLFLLFTSAVVKAADPGKIGQCKDNGCTDCPFYVALSNADGDGGILDTPSCSVYNNDWDGYPRTDGGAATVYHDVSQPDQDCAYILLTPASVTEPGCGYPLGIYRNAICVQSIMQETYMWQRCCGGACTEAGYRRSLRGSGWFGGVPNTKRGPGDSLTPMGVFKSDGTPVEMKEFRAPRYRQDNTAPTRREIESAPSPTAELARRDCDGFIEKRRYTTSGGPVLFGGSVRGPASIEKTSETSVSRTTSVSGTVGDPFGIVSTTVGFETTEETSKSLSYTLEVPEGQLGIASWTPTLSCIEGTFTGCGDAGDQDGNVCTPATDAGDNQAQGVYSVVIQS